MKNGLILHSDGSTSKSVSAVTLNGYSIVRAEGVNDLLRLLKGHLYLSIGNGVYSIEIFESLSSRAPASPLNVEFSSLLGIGKMSLKLVEIKPFSLIAVVLTQSR